MAINMNKKNKSSKTMINRKEWEEFRDSKMLWLANRTLHVFGWSICFNLDSDGEIVNVYPARVKYRGFSVETEEEGFVGISKYMEENAKTLKQESEL